MTPDEALAWAADYLEVTGDDPEVLKENALQSIAHSLWALAALQVKRPSPGRPVDTPDSIPLPVASEIQVIEWTRRISAASDVVALAQILDEVMGYAMPKMSRDDLTSMAWQRRRELRV